MKGLAKILAPHMLAVILVVGIIFLLNFFVGKMPLRWDLTQEKEFSLTPATQKLLGRLEDRLTIKLYFSEDLPPQLLEIRQRSLDLINELQSLSQKAIVTEYVDPAPNEEKERETMMQGILPLNIDIIEKDKRLQKKFYMGMALYYQDRKESLPTVVQIDQLEYDIALRLIKLLQKDKPRIALILPKGKESLYQGAQQFLAEFAEVIPLNSEDKEIKKEKLNAVVIVEPRNLSATLLSELDLLIEGGSNVLIFAGRVDVSDKMQIESVDTGLDEWLKKKGITLTEKLALDVKQNAEAPVTENFLGFNVQRLIAYPFWPMSLKDQMNTDFAVTTGLEGVVFPWSNAFEISAAKDSGWKATPLISSSKTSFLQEDENPNVSFDYAQNMKDLPLLQELPLSLVLKNQKNDKSGQIFLTANFHMLRDQMLRILQPNAIFIQNLFEHASWGNELIGIRSRGKTARPLAEISDDTKNAIKLGHVFAVPGLAIFSGLTALSLHNRRRNRLIQMIQKEI